MIKSDVTIVGGGAAGLACAVYLKKLNKYISVTVVDAGDRLGRKLAATGNGQGNVGNVNMSEEHYFGSGARLAADIACKDCKSAFKLFNNLFEADASGRIYPTGKQASALTDGLIRQLEFYGVRTLRSTKITDVSSGFVLTADNGEKLQSEFVVLAVGGKAQKQFHTDGSSYALAQKFGHTLTPLYPSLVQLKTDTKYIKTLKGIRVDAAVTALDRGKPVRTVRGDVIFTDYGVSGNAVFNISPSVVDRRDASLSIEFLPDVSLQDIVGDIENKRALGYPDSELLSGTLHNQLGRAIIRRAGNSPQDIAGLVKAFTLPVTGSLGFDFAQVTRGGINAEEVNDCLESRIIKNLFFAGEVLDVDGDCGGYNLHWAFTSGMKVAETIAKRLDK